MTVPVMRPWLGVEESTAVADVLASGWIAQGPRVQAFEEAMAERLGADHAVAVSSCTAGLHLVLHSLGLGPTDEVVVPSLSFIATANTVTAAGARPVFADVDPVTQNLTPDTITDALTARTAAVMVVHQAGVPADLVPIAAFCARHGLALVEDAACALGSTYRGSPVGSGSRAAVFSFHPRKVITTGEGGLVATDDVELAQRLRRLREHGMSASAHDRHASGSVVIEEYLEAGFNMRMTDLQAAIGLVQLDRLDHIVAERRDLAARYQAALTPLAGIRTVTDPPWGTTNFQSFWMVLEPDLDLGRDEVLEALLVEGVSARRGIMAAHLEPAYRGRIREGRLPVTEYLTRRSLILPLFHAMTDAEQDATLSVLCRLAGRRP
jgi:dTDP-4-amino-4,6-dideoxygalactose transaminase